MITAILNGYKRGDHLNEQLEALKNRIASPFAGVPCRSPAASVQHCYCYTQRLSVRDRQPSCG